MVMGNSSRIKDSTQAWAQGGTRAMRDRSKDTIEGWPARLDRGNKKYIRGHRIWSIDML